MTDKKNIHFKCRGEECRFLMWFKRTRVISWSELVRFGAECLIREDLMLLEQAAASLTNTISYYIALTKTLRDPEKKQQVKKKREALEHARRHLEEARRLLEERRGDPCKHIRRARRTLKRQGINLKLPNC